LENRPARTAVAATRFLVVFSLRVRFSATSRRTVSRTSQAAPRVGLFQSASPRADGKIAAAPVFTTNVPVGCTALVA
jgi:hypothetical protein